MMGENKVWGPRSGKSQVPEGPMTTLPYPPLATPTGRADDPRVPTDQLQLARSLPAY